MFTCWAALLLSGKRVKTSWNPGSFLRSQESLHGYSWPVVCWLYFLSNLRLEHFYWRLSRFYASVYVCLCMRWCGGDPYKSLPRHLAWHCMHCSELILAWISAAGECDNKEATIGQENEGKESIFCVCIQFFSLLLYSDCGVSSQSACC